MCTFIKSACTITKSVVVLQKSVCTFTKTASTITKTACTITKSVCTITESCVPLQIVQPILCLCVHFTNSIHIVVFATNGANWLG